jgi:protein gp37
MSKLIRLSKTGIEYADHAWNFASGCGNNNKGICKSGGFKCWAYSIVQRFQAHYPNDFKPTIYPEAVLSPLHLKKPSRILCAFMGDLFWDCPEFNPEKKMESYLPSGVGSIQMSLKGWIFTTIKQCPQHQFIFLTKQPQNLIKWSPFPENCRVGVSATDSSNYIDAISGLAHIEARIKYISFEPLLASCDQPTSSYLDASLGREGISWVIIGAQTKPYKPPKIEWVQEIVEACDKAGIPVFLKDNLYPLIHQERKVSDRSWLKYYDIGERLRQEMPK